MSTSEISEENFSKCPCGHGAIIKITDSPDNPWSTVHISYRINCEQCNNEWQIRGRHLYNQSDLTKLVNQKSKTDHLRSELEKLANNILDAFVSSYGFDNFKEEREFLINKGICTEGPIRYKRFRTTGDLPSKHCKPTNNKSWLLKTASDQGLHDKISNLLIKIKKEEEIENIFHKNIKKIQI